MVGIGKRKKVIKMMELKNQKEQIGARGGPGHKENKDGWMTDLIEEIVTLLSPRQHQHPTFW